MKYKKYTTDSGVHVNLLDNGGVILQDTDEKNMIGLSRESVCDLYEYHYDDGWNTRLNIKNHITIKVLDTVYSSYLEDIGLIDRINAALDYFPELSLQTIYIGILKYKREGIFAHVDVNNLVIGFNMDDLINFNTVNGWNVCIFHELMHMVQYSSNLPKSEEYCSIYSIARMPNELIDCDSISYVTDDGNRKHNADLCRLAINYNEAGKRGYIKYLKSLIDEMNATTETVFSEHGNPIGDDMIERRNKLIGEWKTSVLRMIEKNGSFDAIDDINFIMKNCLFDDEKQMREYVDIELQNDNDITYNDVYNESAKTAYGLKELCAICKIPIMCNKCCYKEMLTTPKPYTP